MNNKTARRSNHVSASKMPGITAWIIRMNGTKIGVVRSYADGMFTAVQGHNKLGRFDSKVLATDAVVASFQEQAS